MHVGIFGGAFDPPHMGHVWSVGYHLSKGDFAKILVVPCWNHSFGKKMSPFKHRLAMCQRAFRIYGGEVEVSDIEATLKTTYTYDLLKYLTGMHPHWNITLLLGEDEWAAFPQWHKADEISKMVCFSVMGRAGHPSDLVQQIPRLPDISSSWIRAEVARVGQASTIDPYLPRDVFAYVQRNGLYLNPA